LNREGTTLVMVAQSPQHAAQASPTLRLLDGRMLVDALAGGAHERTPILAACSGVPCCVVFVENASG